MRIFVGIELPESVRASAAKATGSLRTLLNRHAPGLEVRWVEPANLHLTLWFIGEVADAQCDAIRASLERPWTSRAFELEFSGAGVFPGSGPLRVVWLGVSRGGDGLYTLHEEVEERLVGLGFVAERRPYSAHLTVARVKTARPADAAAARTCLADARPVVSAGTIDRITLFRSRLSPRGARYEPLLHVPLK